jgi:hypothetical protein
MDPRGQTHQRDPKSHATNQLHEKKVPDQGKRGPNRACEREKEGEAGVQVRGRPSVAAEEREERGDDAGEEEDERRDEEPHRRRDRAVLPVSPSHAPERRQDLARFRWARRLEESGGEEKKEFVIPVSGLGLSWL